MAYEDDDGDLCNIIYPDGYEDTGKDLCSIFKKKKKSRTIIQGPTITLKERVKESSEYIITLNFLNQNKDINNADSDTLIDKLTKEGVEDPYCILYRLYNMGAVKIISVDKGFGRREGFIINNEGRKTIEKINHESNERKDEMDLLNQPQLDILGLIEEQELKWVSKKELGKNPKFNLLLYNYLKNTMKVIEERTVKGSGIEVSLTSRYYLITKKQEKKEKKESDSSSNSNRLGQNLTTDNQTPTTLMVKKITTNTQTNSGTEIDEDTLSIVLASIADLENEEGPVIDIAQKLKSLNLGIDNPGLYINLLVKRFWIEKTMINKHGAWQLTDKGWEKSTTKKKAASQKENELTDKSLELKNTNTNPDLTITSTSETETKEKNNKKPRSKMLELLDLMAKLENQTGSATKEQIEKSSFKSPYNYYSPLEKEGFVKSTGKGKERIWQLTDEGWKKTTVEKKPKKPQDLTKGTEDGTRQDDKTAQIVESNDNKNLISEIDSDTQVNKDTKTGTKNGKFPPTNDLKPKPDTTNELNQFLLETLFEPLAKIVKKANDLVTQIENGSTKDLSSLLKTISAANGIKDIMREELTFPLETKIFETPLVKLEDFRESVNEKK